jgi:hypothetical protein
VLSAKIDEVLSCAGGPCIGCTGSGSRSRGRS